MSTKKNNDTNIALCQTRLTGLKAVMAGTQTVQIDGQDVAATDAQAVYQKCIDTRTDLANKRAAVEAALAARNAADGAMATFDAGLKRFAQTKFGPTSAQVTALGFEVKKPHQPTVAVKAQAKVKAAATRQALGTKGTQQKKAAKKAAETAPVDPKPALAPATTSAK